MRKLMYIPSWDLILPRCVCNDHDDRLLTLGCSKLVEQLTAYISARLHWLCGIASIGTQLKADGDMT